MGDGISHEVRRKHWLAYPNVERQQMLCGILDYLLDVEDISLEQAIQRSIDTFGCTHEEVMEAVKKYAHAR